MLLMRTIIPLISAALSLALPLVSRQDHSAHCGTWDTIPIGTEYTLELNLWNSVNASGWQCAQVISVDGSTVNWATTWSWAASGGIKSFTNLNTNEGLNKQLSAINSIPTAWSWHQQTSGPVKSDVSFDLFTSSSPGGSNEYEIMIWLANINAGPISYNYLASGQAVPVNPAVTLAGYTWDVYHGNNGYNEVFSFLPTSGTINSFSGDLLTFFTYLINNQGLPSSQYLITAQAGTEATSSSPNHSVTLASSTSLVIN